MRRSKQANKPTTIISKVLKENIFRHSISCIPKHIPVNLTYCSLWVMKGSERVGESLKSHSCLAATPDPRLGQWRLHSSPLCLPPRWQPDSSWSPHSDAQRQRDAPKAGGGPLSQSGGELHGGSPPWPGWKGQEWRVPSAPNPCFTAARPPAPAHH